MFEKSRAGSSLFSCLIVLEGGGAGGLSVRDLPGIRWESNHPPSCLLTCRELDAVEPPFESSAVMQLAGMSTSALIVSSCHQSLSV